ncbi:MAG: fibronectin type III domain-containing protein [Nitrososphaerota archaeon]
MKPNVKNILNIIILLSFLFLYFNTAIAASATISWDANTEPDLSGYKIYYGTSPRTGTDPKVCGLCGYATSTNVVKVTTYTFNNLTNGQTYYFSVTAYDTSNNESAFSAQVIKTIPSSVTADFNNDGKVNSVDLGVLMSYWGSPEKPPADLNQDGVVNSVDFGILLSQWTG